MFDAVRKTIQAAIERANALGDTDKIARLQVAARYLYDAEVRDFVQEFTWTIPNRTSTS